METQFAVGDKAVYPVQGVVEVVNIETREVGGSSIGFYILKILDSGNTIMVPCKNADAVGLRDLIDPEEIEDVYEILRSDEVVSDNQTWNRRHREYMEKIKTGSCFEIAEVVRDLARLRNTKELSFGERRMLETAQNLLVSELALAKSAPDSDIAEELKEIFRSAAA